MAQWSTRAFVASCDRSLRHRTPLALYSGGDHALGDVTASRGVTAYRCVAHSHLIGRLITVGSDGHKGDRRRAALSRSQRDPDALSDGQILPVALGTRSQDVDDS